MCQASVGIMPETSSPVSGAVLGTAVSGHIQLGLHFKYSLLYDVLQGHRESDCGHPLGVCSTDCPVGHHLNSFLGPLSMS